MTTSERGLSLLQAAGRVIGAALVAYLFIITLLVATAQQKVVESLAEENVGYSYSVAVRYYFGRDSLTALSGENGRALRESTTRLRKAGDRLADAEQTLLAQAADLRDDLGRLGAAGCPSGPFAADTIPDPQALISAAHGTRHCVAESSDTDPRLKQADDDVDDGAEALRKSIDDIAAINREMADEKDQIKALDDERASIANEIGTAAKASGIIAILRVFEDSSWPLAKQLVYVPPALTAIILAFSSGLFGALLITLVIFVYPENKFNFTRSEAYGGRILLGGLIALGVFVLLYSGVAVLGGVETGNSQNLMAYAAIGILSGMFSDQAAGWLSEKSAFGKADAPPEAPAPALAPPTQVDEG
jgi:cell division protein FtsB